MAQDLLFATLDPTMRAIRLPGVEKAILSDTVALFPTCRRSSSRLSVRRSKK
jgi:hypothetical protein